MAKQRYPNPTQTCRRITGARPTPRHKLAAAMPFKALFTAPPAFAHVPKQLSYWGNNQYGDCVTAEEAFKTACDEPEDFMTDDTVIGWASDHGVLNGASLDEVLDGMARSGFDQGGRKYGDGKKLSIDFTDINTLRAAIAQGPVKIDNVSNALPSDAGNIQGWYAFGRPRGGSSDHCCSLSGYGTAAECFNFLGVPLPSGVDPNKPDCFLFFTWSTIGVVDHTWLMGTVGEAWIRTPNTTFDPPIPTPPTPPTPPDPIPPTPGPSPWCYRPAVLVAEALLSYVATLPIVPPWLKPLIVEAVALIEKLCPAKAAYWRKMFPLTGN